MIRALLAKLRGEAAFLVLLAVAVAGAWFYVQLGRARDERDALRHWAEIACAASGSPFADDRGETCTARVAALADFKAKANERTAQLLADALADHAKRQTTDTRAARAAAEAAHAAALAMEAADAEAERRNLVDRDWFAAVNSVAGLRPAPRPAR